MTAQDSQLLPGLTIRREDFGGGDYLAGVALGVVGYVDERAADGGGQLLAAYAAEGVEVGGGEDADAGGGVAEGGFDFGEERGKSLFRPAGFTARL